MIRILPNSTRSLHVQWFGLEGDEFRLSRSTSPKSGYEVIAPNLSLPFYVDENVNLNEVGVRYYYKVEGLVGGVTTSEAKGETVKHNPINPIANKAIYENQVVLRVMGNPPVKILLKRRIDKKCPNCWNPITKKPKFAGCPVCNGTGVISGYHEPIEVRISREISQLVNFSNMLDGDKVNQTNINAWISNVPLVSPGDVIVDITDQRFIIERVIQRTHSQHVIRQLLDLIPLEKGHPSYMVPVDWGEGV